MYACVSAPKAMNNQWRDMVLHGPCVIGQTSSGAFRLRYTSLAIDIVDGPGLINETRR